jgi:hypothetical protein
VASGARQAAPASTRQPSAGEYSARRRRRDGNASKAHGDCALA